MRRGDGVRAEQLRHSAGEGTPRAGVEAAGGAEEALWEGEEEVHRGSDKTRGRGDARASCQWVRSEVWNKKQRPTQLTLAVARLCRGRPSRRTGPCGSKTSFWTWLRLRTYRNPRCQSLKAPSWSVSLYGTLSDSIALLHAGHVIKPRWAPARQLTLAGHVDQAHISGFFSLLPLAAAAKRAVWKAGESKKRATLPKFKFAAVIKFIPWSWLNFEIWLLSRYFYSLQLKLMPQQSRPQKMSLNARRSQDALQPDVLHSQLHQQLQRVGLRALSPHTGKTVTLR